MKSHGEIADAVAILLYREYLRRNEPHCVGYGVNHAPVYRRPGSQGEQDAIEAVERLLNPKLTTEEKP